VVLAILTSEGPQVRILLRPLFSQASGMPRADVREPNGEPKLMMILFMAGYAKPRVTPKHRIRLRADPRRLCLAENAGLR
jgi:hypothetical protein